MAERTNDPDRRLRRAFFWALLLGVFAGVVASRLLDHWPQAKAEEPRPPAQVDRASDGVKRFSEQGEIYRHAARKIAPAVVSITTFERVRMVTVEDLFGFHSYYRRPMREGWQVRGIGSGFIYDKTNGYILTNSHVVEGGEERAGREWWVRFADKRELPAKLIGADPKTDVAVLQVKAEGLAAVTLGDSDKIEVADSVLAVGNPFGLLEQTVTAGIISAKARRGLGLSSYEDFLQTDAAINQGNSGGPLVNLEGHVIGINTAIYSRTGGYQGVGFAIPINQADKIARKLIKDGRVVRGWMGIEARELTQPQAKRLKLSEGTGLLVEKRFRNSPAAQGGVELGDVIVKLAGREIRSAEELRDLIAELEPGKKVPVQVVREARGGRLETLDLTVTLGEQPQE